MNGIMLTVSVPSSENLTNAIAEGIGAVFTFVAIAWVIRIALIVAVIALITWVVKKIWYAGSEKKEKKNHKAHDQWSDDWLSNAHNRQQNRYDYTDPERSVKWVYNEKARIWVDSEQMEREEHQRAYEETRRKWQAYEEKVAEQEAEERRVQAILDEKNRPIYLTEEEKELSKQIRIERKEPTFEEWKKQREQK